jgi:hypothetical protein
MLAFAWNETMQAVDITCDDAGIELLVSKLQSLRGSYSHVHLRAGSAVEGRPPDLSPETPHGNPAITEVIITHGGFE